MSTARLLIGDVFDRLAELPDGSVDLVMTSPPFLALRSYLPADHPDKGKEIGSEATPAEFIDTLLALTAEWGRVLAPHGSLCVELGDTYAGSGGAGGDYTAGGLKEGQNTFVGSSALNRTMTKNARVQSDSHAQPIRDMHGKVQGGGAGWPLDKSLTGIPTLYAWSLAYGRNLLTGEPSPAGQWRIRNLVAWVRPNPPVGALGDKFRPATSYLTIATRARDRWFDLDAVRTQFSAKTEANLAAPNSIARTTARSGETDNAAEPGSIAYGVNPAGAPPLDWWNIPPRGYAGAHYATFPEALCERPIEAMCPRRVCTTCGQPSRRITGPAEYVNTRDGQPARLKPEGWRNGSAKVGGSLVNQSGGSGADQNATRIAPTAGWSTCGCPGTNGQRLDGYHTGTGWRPGHVLDPFAGSGTTAAVATGRGRDCTLIDLDERNADLVRERLGMFLDIDHPTTQAAS